MSIFFDDNSGSPSDTTDGIPVKLKDSLANERNPGTANEYGVSVPEWNYTVIDHADTSPVAVSGGVPAIIGNVYCSEAMAGSPDFAFYDDSTEVYPMPVSMTLSSEKLSLAGTIFATDLNCVIASAGTAGKIVVQWRVK